MKCLLRDGLIGSTRCLFDYGCGHGENIELLNAQGIDCRGWDPVFRPDEPLESMEVVNLGYVINVIERPEERAETLQRAWNLSRKLLSVSAQIRVNGRGKSQVEFGDGVVTKIGTFQKFYTQTELREYLEFQLGMEAIPAALGVFYVFKDESLQQQYLSSRSRRRSATPRRRLSELRFDEHRELLESLIAVAADLGRMPEPDEFSGTAAICNIFGSLKRAVAIIERVTGIEGWDEMACSAKALIHKKFG